MKINKIPSGIGISYRPEFDSFLDKIISKIDLIEILSDEFATGKFFIERLPAAIKSIPLIAHNTSLSIGSNIPINNEFVRSLRQFLDQNNIICISDHLTWQRTKNYHLDNFLPVSYSEKGLLLVTNNIKSVQQILQRPLGLENPVFFMKLSNVKVADEALSLNKLCIETNCQILLDVNNLYINAYNFSYNPYEYIDRLNCSNVIGLHIAGYSKASNYLVDSHMENVAREVWKLAAYALQKTSANYLILERDNQSANVEQTINELEQMRYLWNCYK